MRKIVICLSMMFCLFAQEVTHIVKQGDTLWDIAGFYYQNPFLWPYIWRANLDKISDPHWIYPEQVFVIPPAPESLLAVPAESIPIVPPETVVLKPEEESLPPETVYYAPPPRKEEIVVSLVEPEKKVFSEDLIHRVGYLSEEEIVPFGKIIKSEPEHKQITNFMKVYIDHGTNPASPGELYSIYRVGDGVNDPKTGRFLGRVIEILGKLKIEEVREGSTGQVLVSHDIINPGELLMPYPKFEIPVNVTLKPTERLLEGQIAYVLSKAKVTTENYAIVYINLGSNHDVTAGDLFRIYEEKTYGGRILPDLIVGEIAVVSTRPNSSAGIVTWRRRTHKVNVGDKIRLYMEAH